MLHQEISSSKSSGETNGGPGTTTNSSQQRLNTKRLGLRALDAGCFPWRHAKGMWYLPSRETYPIGKRKIIDSNKHTLLRGGFNPSYKILVNWNISPARGGNKTCFKPLPSLGWGAKEMTSGLEKKSETFALR